MSQMKEYEVAGFMAEGNTCAMHYNQLSRLNLPTVFGHDLKYGFWAVVELQEARACSTKHGTIGPKNMPSLIGAVKHGTKTEDR